MLAATVKKMRTGALVAVPLLDRRVFCAIKTACRGVWNLGATRRSGLRFRTCRDCRRRPSQTAREVVASGFGFVFANSCVCIQCDPIAVGSFFRVMHTSLSRSARLRPAPQARPLFTEPVRENAG